MEPAALPVGGVSVVDSDESDVSSSSAAGSSLSECDESAKGGGMSESVSLSSYVSRQNPLVAGRNASAPSELVQPT